MNNKTNTQTGLILDGTGGFTEGDFQNIFLGGVNTCLRFTGTDKAAASGNHITGVCVARGRAARGLDVQDGNGNLAEMDVENATTTVFLANRRTVVNNMFLIYNCGETTFADVGGTNVANNAIIALGGCDVSSKINDLSGGLNSIYNIGQLRMPNGSASKPSYAAQRDETGLFFPFAGVMAFASAGLTKCEWGRNNRCDGKSQLYSLSPGDPTQFTGDTVWSRLGPGIWAAGNVEAVGNKGGYIQSGNTIRLASDFKLPPGTSLQTIFSWTVQNPGVATVWSFHCYLPYSQTTPVADAFGIQVATNSPKRADASGLVATASTPSFARGKLSNLTSTAATNIVTFTPEAGELLEAYIDGTIQLGPSTNKINVMASQAASGDGFTLSAGAYCAFTP